MRFPDGDNYCGDFNEGKFDGLGQLVNEKEKYIGDWKEGLKDG